MLLRRPLSGRPAERHLREPARRPLLQRCRGGLGRRGRGARARVVLRLPAARRAGLHAVQGLPRAPPPGQEHHLLQQHGSLQQGHLPDVQVQADPAAGSPCPAVRRTPHHPRRLPVGLPDRLHPGDGPDLPSLPKEGARPLSGLVPGHPQGPHRPEQRLGLGPAVARPAHDRQTAGAVAVRRQGPLRRGLAGQMEGREGGREGVLHARGGLLVPGDRDLPDRADEARQHPGLHSRGHQGHRLLDADAADHGLPREGLVARLPADDDTGPPVVAGHLPVHCLGHRASAHGDLRDEGQAGHRAQGHQEQEHTGEEERGVRHCRLWSGCAFSEVSGFSVIG